MSTLDGSLHALNKQTGDLKWTLKDGEQGAVILPPLDPELGGGEVTVAWKIRAWGLESNKSVSSGSCPTFQLCAFEKVTSPLWASMSSPVKWGQG